MLAHWKSGEPETATRLMALVYDELRLFARAYLQRERPDHLCRPPGWSMRHICAWWIKPSGRVAKSRPFLGVAARVMRRILVDHARATGRRNEPARKTGWGGGRDRGGGDSGVDLIALDDALGDLAELAPQQSEIVDLRFFGGLTVEEVAETLELSPRTVKREWRIAKAWLQREVFGKTRMRARPEQWPRVNEVFAPRLNCRSRSGRSFWRRNAQGMARCARSGITPRFGRGGVGVHRGTGRNPAAGIVLGIGSAIAGQQFGAYSIMREIGRGGLGRFIWRRERMTPIARKSRSNSFAAGSTPRISCAASGTNARSWRSSSIPILRASSMEEPPTTASPSSSWSMFRASHSWTTARRTSSR